MKSLIILGVISLVGSSVVTTAAFAQKSKREQIVATCIAKAQDQIKSSGNPNDPGYNNRYNVYASCMRQAGQRP
jgi:hypothetical protein